MSHASAMLSLCITCAQDLFIILGKVFSTLSESPAVVRHLPGDDDRKDVESFLSGDRQGFDRLVLRHKDRIFNLCYRLIGDREEANDCAQDAFIKAFKAMKRFRFDCSLSTWLSTIAVNTCKNRLHSSDFLFWKRHSISLDSRTEGDEDGIHSWSLEDPAPSPLALLSRHEQEVLLHQALGSLCYEHRTAIVLYYIEGLSYDEICTVAGCNIGTLKSRLARARLELHKRVLEQGRGVQNGM